MSDPRKQPIKNAFGDNVVRQDGTRLFRLVNPELFARPSRGMMVVSMIGSAAFAGVLGYFMYQDFQAAKARPAKQRT